MASIISASTTSATALNMSADTTGVLQLATGATPTTAVTVDTSQNVGIGTSSPTNYGTFKTLAIQGSSTSSGGVLDLKSSNGSAFLQLYSTDTGGVINQVTSLPLLFNTNATERMRIDSSGNVLVGTTSLPSNGGLLFVAGGISSNSGYQTKAGNTSALSGNRFNINWTGTAQLWIDSTNIGTFAFTSDYRIKKNIETSTTPALERISQIRPVTYQMADYGTLFKASEEVKEGFIAHELAEVIPSAVEGEKDAEDQIQSLKLDALCSVMVKAIQEQQTIINDLKARIETLEGAKL